MTFTNQQLADQILKRLIDRGLIVVNDQSGASDLFGGMLERYAEKIRSEAVSVAPEAVEGCILPEQGDMVIVVRGKKVEHGTQGVLFWMKEQEYSGRRVTRIGIKDETGTPHWTYLKNVVKVTA